MLSRILSRLLVLASIVVLAGVTYYFMDEYRGLRQRERALREVSEIADAEGPCSALSALRHFGPVDASLQQTINALRSRLVTAVVGEDDLRGRRVLAAADREGIIDRSLCEQIRLSHEVGAIHPVLALLRYTREGGSPCDEEPRLAEVLDGLGSHRPMMLHALMRDVQDLGCLSPTLAEKIAAMVATELGESPHLLDGLDEPRIIKYLNDWAPVETAQLGCRAEARGDKSSLLSAIGCSADGRQRILVRYQTIHELAATETLPALPAASAVLLLHQSGPFCEVMPADGGELRTLACRNLRLASDLVLAVRIETLSYGRAEADLLAGLGTYVGERGDVVAAAKEPDLRSWFGYNRDGELIGAAYRVELDSMAAMIGEVVPDEPLRTFCKRAGAKYCYDVDWAHMVSRLRGEPVLYLSRPADVFLTAAALGSEAARARFHEAFGREPKDQSFWRVYGLSGGGELVVDADQDQVELRWRGAPQGAWYKQSFGSNAAPTSSRAAERARLLAALDLQKDGRPELVIQRLAPAGSSPESARAAAAPEKADELLLVRLLPGDSSFAVVNRLTVHEY